MDQAKSAYEQAVNGYTKEEHEIAEANVGKAVADIKAAQSIIDQMVIYAPVASQVYRRNVEPGEYVSPGVPLVTLINLDDMWVHFDLREDLVRTLKIGDRFGVSRTPVREALRQLASAGLILLEPRRGARVAMLTMDRLGEMFEVMAEMICACPRLTNRTFSIRAYPVDKVPELRPGMSAYMDWQQRR